MSVEERVSRVFVDGIGLEATEVTPAAALKQDLGIDSTELVEVLVALEKEFGMTVPDGVIRGDSTVNEIIHYISSRTITQ
jgi:acyl carrier protein